MQAGDAPYRIGFAMLPQDALVGEDVRVEFQFLQMPATPERVREGGPDPAATPQPGRPVGSDDAGAHHLDSG